MSRSRHVGGINRSVGESARRFVRLDRALQVSRRGPGIAAGGRAGPLAGLLLGRTAYIVARNLISPQVYRSVGLDPDYAHRVALANPAHQETIRFGGEKIVAFLTEQGLVGAPGMHWWRKSYLLG